MKTLQNPPAYVIRSSAQAVPLWQAIGETVEQWRKAEAEADSGIMRASNRAAYLADRLDALAREFLPSGSGFDAGTQFDRDGSRASVIRFTTAFHHMNESGYYDGWTQHAVTLRASLSGFPDMRVTGRDRNGIKEYIGDAFAEALRLPVARVFDKGEPGEPSAIRFVPVETVSESDALDACASLWESVLEAARLEESEAEHKTPPPGGFPAPLPRPVSATLESHGYGATRLAIAELSPVAHIAWEIARREGFDSCFDWEFCPRFTARALSWSPDGAELPALRSEWRDISRAIGRGMTA